MSLQKLMTNYAAYNLWANKTLADWLESKPAEALDTEVSSSFPGIAKTLVHIWDTERFWLSFLKNEASKPSFRFQPFEGSNEEAIKELLAHSEEFATYVGTLSESQLAEICVLDTPWAKGQLPKYEFIQHAINHNTYHRGQIITIGRNVGFTDFPSTDHSFYALSFLQK